MICWEVNLIAIEFKVKHKDVLIKALEAMGYKVYEYNNILEFGEQSINLKTGFMKVISNNIGNLIKRKYSEKAIEKLSSEAQKRKWILKQINENRLQLRRY